MEKKQVGRPKLYDSSSEKLEAFRKRLESAGFMRKELLVTQETWDQVMMLAKENGVSASDAASGLLEHGAKAFMAKRATASVAFSRREGADIAAQEPKPQATPRARNAVNPIEDFFIKRKRLAKAASSEEGGV